MRFLYKKKNDIIYNLHPVSISTYIFSFLFLSLLFRHPVFLASIFLMVAVAILATENFIEWKKYLIFSVPLALSITVINTLFIKIGATVIYSGPIVPFIGKIRLTMEGFYYGAAMGLRILTVISVFCLFSYLVQPDRFMKIFSKFGSKTIFIMMIALRLFPLMLNDYKRIGEAQRFRGSNMKSSGWIEKIRNLRPVTSILMLSGLERSYEMAESMDARGYGSGKRSTYRKEIWRTRDTIFTVVSMLAVSVGIYAAISGISFYEYYPRLGEVKAEAFIFSIVITLLLLLPVILNRWCELWPSLKSKI